MDLIWTLTLKMIPNTAHMHTHTHTHTHIHTHIHYRLLVPPTGLVGR